VGGAGPHAVGVRHREIRPADLFDRRGVGLSDRIAGDVAPTMEQLVADVQGVLDAAGSREAVVVGIGDGGKVAAAFVASHPERTRALVLYNSLPLRPGWQVAGGLSRDQAIAHIEQGWGTGVMAGPMGDDRLRAYFARVERRACPPRAAAVMLGAIFDADLGDALARVRAPTTVLHFGEHTGQPAVLVKEFPAVRTGDLIRDLDDADARKALHGSAATYERRTASFFGATRIGL
jgi:pimeloyl-ACP methyl ester carboxylesterase